MDDAATSPPLIASRRDARLPAVIILSLLLSTDSGLRAAARSAPAAMAPDRTVTVRIDRSHESGVSHFETGVTHGQYSLDPWGDPASVARGTALLKAASHYQNQHLMGWGADNPEPSPGVYRWGSLDRRIRLIRTMGAAPVITLCAAPDWMKGGKPGETDWSKIEVPPLPQHYADFAALAAQTARRYPDVLHFQVWNEMKGLWNAADDNWDYAGYTSLYNQVYDALKAVNPAIRVGGPYLVIEGTGSRRGDWATETPVRARQWKVIDYWLKHKHGADFITLDRGLVDYHDHTHYSDAELMALTGTFGQVARQVRARTSLPLWWAEYYGAGGSRDFIAASYASIMAGMVKAGCAAALLWQPKDAANELKGTLFSDTRQPGGGRPYPLYAVFKAFHDDFAPGTPLYDATASSAEIGVLASSRAIMLINRTPRPLRVRVLSREAILRPYAVKVIANGSAHVRKAAGGRSHSGDVVDQLRGKSDVVRGRHGQ